MLALPSLNLFLLYSFWCCCECNFLSYIFCIFKLFNTSSWRKKAFFSFVKWLTVSHNLRKLICFTFFLNFLCRCSCPLWIMGILLCPEMWAFFFLIALLHKIGTLVHGRNEKIEYPGFPPSLTEKAFNNHQPLCS